MEEINAEQNFCLNVVLLGKTRTGISASGNTILGRKAFISKKSPKSVTQDVAVESGTVGGITVTVCDTPGFCHTKLKDDEIHQKYEEVLQKCESGPCVFLLAIKADRFSEEERETVKKIEELLGEKRLEKTWILFTRGDELEDENTTIKEFINDTEPLKRLVQKYEQRYHVFNNKKKGPSDQVQGLLTKIRKPYFDVQGEGAEILNPLKRKILTDSEPAAPVSSPSSRRIVLLGKSGVGKSATGNTILGQKEFDFEMSTSSVTSECSDAHATVSGRSVSVVDTPGLFDTQMSSEELVVEIARSVYLSSPGPHAFLIVFPVNMRFTEQEQKIPQMIEMMFGEEVLKYSIILFTYGDLIEEKPIEELIKENCRLRDLVQQCGGRFHVFNNKAQNTREQVNDLLQKIDSMIEQNGGGHYSNQMYEDAQKFRREEEESRRREEEERQREEEERKLQVEKQIQEKIERMKKITEKKVRAEMEAELERFKAEKQREEEERKQEREKIAAEKRADESKNGFGKFLSKYWGRILLGAVVVGLFVAVPIALAGVDAGAAIGELGAELVARLGAELVARLGAGLVARLDAGLVARLGAGLDAGLVARLGAGLDAGLLRELRLALMLAFTKKNSNILK